MAAERTRSQNDSALRGTKFEAMKASYEQALHDVNPATPPKKKPKAVEHVDLFTPPPPTRPRHAAVNKLFMSCS